MNLLNWFTETKAARAYSVHVQNLPRAAWSPNNYLSYVSNGYQINVVAYQAVNKIADAIGSMKWQVFDQSGNQLESHPLLDLINRPNPWQSGREWWRAKTAYLLLSGDGFDERVTNSQGIPQELWTLRPDRTSFDLDANGMPSRFVYQYGSQKVYFPANSLTGDADIRHTRLFSPVNDWRGQSPMQAASRAIDQHNEAMTWLKSLLQNSAKPSGALLLDKEKTLTSDEYDRLREDIETNFAGSQNSGRPMLLEGGMKWEALSLSPADMGIIELKDSAARDISLAFGVPPLLLNIPGDNTYSNYREGRLGFYEDTVIPLVDLMTDELNGWLSPKFGGTYIKADYDSIEAISEKRRGLWEMVDTSDEITVNEARTLKGFPPLPAPLGNMLMADLRSSRRGHESDRSNNPGGSQTEEIAYGDE